MHNLDITRWFLVRLLAYKVEKDEVDELRNSIPVGNW